MTFGLVDDASEWKKLRKRLTEETRNSYARVGVLGTDAGEERDGISQARLLAVHEFGADTGTTRIPERRPLRGTFDEHRPEYEALVKKGVQGIIDGKTSAEKLLDIVGQKMVADIQRRVREGVEPANADSTVEKKGSDKPLIDTGTMLNSITYDVTTGKKS